MRTTTTTALAVGATALATHAAPADAAGPPPVKPLEPPHGGRTAMRAQTHAERRRELRRRLAARATRLAAHLTHARGDRFHRTAYRSRLRRESTGALRSRVRTLRGRLTAPAAPPVLQAIAACESGGNPQADTGNGFYGKYQFTLSTWQSVGGTGNPAAASEAEQDRRAAVLYAREGSSPWPVCGR
jgi:hypothetical protein